MKKRSIHNLGAFLLLGLLCTGLPSCCPSGAWVDNFNALYNLITVPPDVPGSLLQVSGTVDTRGAGCGIWSIRPPKPGEIYDPINPVVFVGENPSPNPLDNCCYRYLFQGNTSGAGCLTILGEFETIGGKCEESGSMFLEVVI